MKQIFTLLTATIGFFISASAQINETFENGSSLSFYTNNCWQFAGVGLSTAGNVYNANSLSIIPTTSTSTSTTSNNAQIITPYVNFVTGTTISFAYKISNKLSTQASRVITVQLQDIDGTYTSLGTVVLDKNTATSILSYSGVSTITGVKKLVINIAGNGDGNTYLYLDNISINSTYNYNLPYGCSSTSVATLPLKLTGFQGALVADKTQLQWSVAENETGDLFEVQRSNDGKNFNTVAIVLTTRKQGNESYLYNEAAQSITYYKLKIVSKDKSATYSNVVLIKSKTESGNTISLLQNPIQQSVNFSFISTTSTGNIVTVYNLTGAKLYCENIMAQKGKNSVSINLDTHLSKGTYVLEVKNTNERSIAKFIKM